MLGFHGCDHSVAEAILSGKSKHLVGSENSYDWLGTGIYFWDTSPARALEYAIECTSRPSIKSRRIRKPAVIGAVIDLGNCLDLLDAQFFDLVRDAYRELQHYAAAANIPMPENRPVTTGQILLHNLDCDVINTIHRTWEKQGREPFDTVRAAFVEGQPLYPTANFFDKNHIQLCVRNTKMIKGYFRPIAEG